MIHTNHRKTKQLSIQGLYAVTIEVSVGFLAGTISAD